MDKKKFKIDEKDSNGTCTALGMCIGVAIGAAIGVAMGNIGTWLPIGLCLGLAFGASFDLNKKKGEDKDSES